MRRVGVAMFALFVSTGAIAENAADHPLDSSTFSIYSTYLDFLQSEGFEILETIEPGSSPGRFLAYEVASNTASITSSDTRDTAAIADSPAAGPRSELIASGGFIRVLAGYAAYGFVDPAFAGGAIVTTEASTDTVAKLGYRNPLGPYAQVGYYPNPNFGLTLDWAFLITDEVDTCGSDISIQTGCALVVAKTGVSVRMEGNQWPSSLSVGAGGGVLVADLFERVTEGATTQEYTIEGFVGLPYANADLTVPVFGIVKLSAGFEYLFARTTDLNVVVPDTADYHREYLRPNPGGLVLRVGLVTEL